MTTPSNGALPPHKQIRFVNNQGQPPLKRRRINAACLTCRKRKTRCAGERPTCSTCAKNGHQCHGYSEIPERKRENGVSHRDGFSVSPDPDDEYHDDNKGETNRQPWKVNVKSENPLPSQNDREVGNRRTAGPNAKVTASSNLSTASHDPRDAAHRSEAIVPAQQHSQKPKRTVSFHEENQSPSHRSPAEHQKRQHETHRVPYFRYFGSTAIIPGYKQMMANVPVRDRRRSRGGSFSGISPHSPDDYRNGSIKSTEAEPAIDAVENLPVYDQSDPNPVHPLIIELVKTFFLHLGCNYPFLREAKFLRMVKQKRIEPILVDAVCALAARFADLPLPTTGGTDSQMSKSDYGHVFSQRAKGAATETFGYPSIGAVQAFLLIAYECFGADQHTALWIYLGIAIRMAVDLGLHTEKGTKWQGENDPWYARRRPHSNSDDLQRLERVSEEEEDDDDDLSLEAQREIEDERVQTWWAVFILDRIISSSNGRSVSFKDDDYEITMPEPTLDAETGWPAPFPTFIEIIHLYGRVSDAMNNLQKDESLTKARVQNLIQMENDLTKLYQKQDPRLHFNAENFQHYVKVGQGNTFILLHFWFHALIILLHQPAMLVTEDPLEPSRPLFANSRELSMSSAETIAHILAFGELIDPKSFYGNPFTSQPIYIAACAFLMDSGPTSKPDTTELSLADEIKAEPDRSDGHVINLTNGVKPPTRHSLLASVANQNYQLCHKSLTQLKPYWGGVQLVLNALDQKSKGIKDCETYTTEEYESARKYRRVPRSRFAPMESAPSPKPSAPGTIIALSLSGTLTGVSNPSPDQVTVVYKAEATPSVPPAAPAPIASAAATPTGNMVYDPIRQSQPEPVDSLGRVPSAYPQPHTSDVRNSPLPPKASRYGPPLSGAAATSFVAKSRIKSESPLIPSLDQSAPRADGKLPTLVGMAHVHNASHLNHQQQQRHDDVFQVNYDAPPRRATSEYDQSGIPGPSPTSSLADSGSMLHPSQYGHNGHNRHSHGMDQDGDVNGEYSLPDFAQSGLAGSSYANMGGPLADIDFISYDTHGNDLSQFPPEWLNSLEYFPNEYIADFFDERLNGGSA